MILERIASKIAERIEFTGSYTQHFDNEIVELEEVNFSFTGKAMFCEAGELWGVELTDVTVCGEDWQNEFTKDELIDVENLAELWY